MSQILSLTSFTYFIILVWEGTNRKVLMGLIRRILRSYTYERALGPEGKLLFFVLATFYLEISTFITRNFEIKSS